MLISFEKQSLILYLSSQVTSLDGLSQLVMPILQDENSRNSQFVGKY